MARVFLNRAAFVALTTAAAEAYRRECYGVLLGSAKRRRAWVGVALAYQSARRKPTSVDLVDRRRRIIRRLLRAFPHYDYIGEFHSHPGRGEEPGRAFLGCTDLEGVRPGEFEIVVGVRQARARLPWRHCADGSLAGAAGKFHFKIRAYAATPSGDGVRGFLVGVRCDYAVTTANSHRLLRRREAAPGP